MRALVIVDVFIRHLRHLPRARSLRIRHLPPLLPLLLQIQWRQSSSSLRWLPLVLERARPAASITKKYILRNKSKSKEEKTRKKKSFLIYVAK